MKQDTPQIRPTNIAPKLTNKPAVISPRRVVAVAALVGLGVGIASVGIMGAAFVGGGIGAGAGVVAAGGAGVVALGVDAGAEAAEDDAADPEPPVLSIVMAGIGFWRIVHPSTKAKKEGINVSQWFDRACLKGEGGVGNRTDC